MITIVDYGMGNFGALSNMFRRIGVESNVSSNPELIARSEKILLPGVGAFDSAMDRIEKSGIREALDEAAVTRGVPILGICLGMQLLTHSSEEGKLPGFGWIDAATVKFPASEGIRVPHMGWNFAKPTRSTPMTDNLVPESRFYFVHSYHVTVSDPVNSIMTTNYGGIEFNSAIRNGNIYGAQFHPEKSHKYGMKLLEHFSNIK